MRRYLFLLVPALFTVGCTEAARRSQFVENGRNTAIQPVAKAFAQNRLYDYWYEGKAEITRYELQQNRYGDVHPGEAVSIFVTEDFLADKQVKNDHYQRPNSVPVLKNNLILKFVTGLYDYSIMTSVFTPVNNRDWPATLKVTTSSQDWCGHTFTQLNYRENVYRMQLHSYFEMEADQDREVGKALLEDELFNRIRINPEGLPTGDLEIIPGMAVARLMHLDVVPRKAEASLGSYPGKEFTGAELKVYRLIYPELNRTYEIIFEGAEPYRIAGWKDTYPSLFDKQLRTTIARRTHTIKSAYWEQNGPEDRGIRTELGLGS